MLSSRQRMWIGCGEDLTLQPPIQMHHRREVPVALGRPASQVSGKTLATTAAGDEGIYVAAQLLIMERIVPRCRADH
jgi:hypothetical protein